MRVLIASVVVAFVLFPALADRSKTRPRVITGTVTQWQAGETITIVNEQSDPQGIRLTLRDTTYEGRAGAIKTGATVTVWYRGVG